jgi:PAS domain S-box-containing protein
LETRASQGLRPVFMSFPETYSEHESQQDLRLLLDNAPDAIGRFDRQLRHVYVNEATARANGRPASDFMGKTMEDLDHRPEICEIINSNLSAVFETGQERTVELLFPGPQGNAYFQSRMAPELDEDGEVRYVLVVSRDISDQRRAEAALIESDKRAIAADLANQLAHEINNPLTVVNNALYLLQKNGSLDSEATEILDMIHRNVETINGISHRILSLNERL